VVFDTFFSGLMLLVGVALGWVLARRTPPGPVAEGSLSREQLGGLITELAGDDPDRALAALTQAAEMDHATAELHLTLGSLFRRRGEVDRALRIHEALLARPVLRPELREQTRYELAQDYLKAGVIDRAEALLTELGTSGAHVAPALKMLQGLHEQARDWRQAIDVARRLEAVRGAPQKRAIGHYLCELADEARAGGDPAGATRLASQALAEDPDCVRANLLLGALHEAAGDLPAAIKSYRRVLDQDGRFLPEVIEPLRRCCAAAGREAEFSEFLADAKEMTKASSLPWVAEAHLLRAEGQDPLPHLAQSLEQRPSRAVLAQFLAEMQDRPEVVAAGLGGATASLRGTVERLMAATPGYQCRQCGFQPRQLFWQCPACKHWATTAPVDDVWQLAQGAGR
jgi:lipopolysaccharide assembly protein B